jgi:hypothetical protein
MEGNSMPPKKKNNNGKNKVLIYKSTASAWRNVAILSASIVIILYVHTSLAPPALPSCIRILISI